MFPIIIQYWKVKHYSMVNSSTMVQDNTPPSLPRAYVLLPDRYPSVPWVSWGEVEDWNTSGSTDVGAEKSLLHGGVNVLLTLHACCPWWGWLSHMHTQPTLACFPEQVQPDLCLCVRPPCITGVFWFVGHRCGCTRGADVRSRRPRRLELPQHGGKVSRISV